MKKALKVTFGTMLAVSLAAPGLALAVDQKNETQEKQEHHQHHGHHHKHKHHHGHHHRHHQHHNIYDPLHSFAAWVEGTYTKPSNNGLSVGDQLFATSAGAVGPDTLDGGRRHVFINPDDEFDYKLGLSYRMPHTHSRLFFTYDHYNNDKDFQGDIDIRNVGFQPPGQTQGIASLDLNSHEFRVGAIHDLHFGDRFCLDLLAFFEYDKIRQTLEETNSQGGLVHARETENKVRGFGPGLGFMTRWYSYSPHWHIFAGANTSLIAARNDYHQAYAAAANVFYSYEPEKSDSLVGKVDIEFGLNYRCAMRHDFCGTAWDVSLGMRYMNMFNAFKNGNTAFNPPAELTANDSHIGVQNDAANLGGAQDWGRYGPFLRFQVGGNRA